MGSYHIGEKCQLQSRAFEHVFKDSEKVVFEVDSPHDITNLSKQIQPLLISLIKKKGLPSNPEESLKGILDTETYDLLKQKVIEKDLSLDSLSHFKPWVFLFIQQSQQISEQLDIAKQKPECGLDFMISKQAQSKNKPTTGLETVDYQFELFANLFISLKPEEISEYLELFAKSETEANHSSKQLINDITNSIDQGNLSDIEVLIDNWRKYDPDVYKSLLIDRNYNWIPTIEEFLKEKEDKLIVVGAGHLVGEEGVINLLEKKGYAVRRMRNSELRHRK